MAWCSDKWQGYLRGLWVGKPSWLTKNYDLFRLYWIISVNFMFRKNQGQILAFSLVFGTLQYGAFFCDDAAGTRCELVVWCIKPQYKIERPCRCSGGWSPASHCYGLGMRPGEVMWDLWGQSGTRAGFLQLLHRLLHNHLVIIVHGW